MTDQPDPRISDADLMAYCDRSLDRARMAEIDAALATDAAAQARLAEWRQQTARIASLYQPAAAEPLPPRLDIRKIAGAQRVARQSWQRLAAAAVLCLAIGGGGGWFLGQRAGAGLAADPIETALAAHRLFAQDVVYPVEVAGDADGALGVWLSKRLDRKFVVPNLEKAGWRLVGGSLLPDGRKAAAQIMYEDGAGQRLTLFFTAAAPHQSGPPRFETAGDLHVMTWADAGLTCTIVGSVGRDEIKGIAASVYDQLT